MTCHDTNDNRGHTDFIPVSDTIREQPWSFLVKIVKRELNPWNPCEFVKVWSCDVLVHFWVRGGHIPVYSIVYCIYEVSKGSQQYYCFWPWNLFIGLSDTNHLNWQKCQSAATHLTGYSRWTFPLPFVLSASLGEKIASPADFRPDLDPIISSKLGSEPKHCMFSDF